MDNVELRSSLALACFPYRDVLGSITGESLRKLLFELQYTEEAVKRTLKAFEVQAGLSLDVPFEFHRFTDWFAGPIEGEEDARPEVDEFFEHLTGYFELQQRLAAAWQTATEANLAAADAMMVQLRGSPIPWNDLSWRQEALDGGRPVADLEEAFQAAQAAHPIFTQIVKDLAQAANVNAEEIAYEHEGKPHYKAHVAPLKAKARAAEKAQNFEIGQGKDRAEGPAIAWVMDWNRATIFVEDLSQFQQVWDALQKHKDVKNIYNARNRFIDPPPPGYRDWNLEFQVQVGVSSHMCELQVHLLSIKLIIVQGDSHVHYSYFRSYFRGADRKAVTKRIAILERLHRARSLRDAVEHAITAGGDALEAMDELLELLCHYPLLLKLREVKLRGTSDPLEASRALSQLGDVLREMGRYPQALACFEQTLANNLQSSGEDHVDVGQSYSKIGRVLELQGRYDEALAKHKKSLAIRRRALGEAHADVGESYYKVALVHYRQAKHCEALNNYEKSLEIRVKVLGEDHRDVAHCFNDIAIVYSDQGNYDKALDNFQKALAIRLKSLGEEHPQVASRYADIGNVYNFQDNYDEALDNHKKALAIRLKSLGEEHPHVGSSYINIASVYAKQGKHEKALSYYHKSLAIEIKSLGEEHPSVAGTHWNMATVNQAQKEYRAAASSLAKAVTARQKCFGDAHEYTEKARRFKKRMEQAAERQEQQQP
eukprot:TRINITY_DN4938_c0_g1_i4.p1 TRINITY_DN4938_c0_g1~~TRINITY_DN4938_c0_g1_i4.p1  ORF type:complete len:712 (-),score=152.92 TRINITY_DN4938_c0_g1_i4:249-2384(-)